MADPLERAGLTVVVFENRDPACPPSHRFVAHAFGRDGQPQTATRFGATQECGEKLAAFLACEIARNDPSARNRRLAKARAAKAAKPRQDPEG